MKTPVPDYLSHILSNCSGLQTGALADYIPELANADPNKLAVALSTVDGEVYSAGDDDYEFTIQSMSKPFAYAYVLQHLGLQAVLEKVGVEPSGEAFNEISLDPKTCLPKNPMINSGAITTHSLIPQQDDQPREEVLRQFLSELAGRELSFDEDVFNSEMNTAYRNLSIAYMLRTYKVIETDPEEIVKGYIRQCSIKVTVQDLVHIASVLANGGVNPNTGKRVLDQAVVRQVLSVMTSCGMYDAAGDWLSTVGIPAKSGVAGGIFGVLPGQVGLAVFSPRLDEHGNSVRGIDIMQQLSSDMGLHLMEGTPTAQTIVQKHYYTGKDNTYSIYELRGVLRFTEAEMLLRILQDEQRSTQTVVLDLSHISMIYDVGQRMLLEGIDRLLDDNYDVYLIDPESVLAQRKTHLGVDVKVFKTLDELREKV